MDRPFTAVRASAVEVASSRPGDNVVPVADVVMDRAFTAPAPPASVWPWVVALGKGRGGWYLPRRVERFVPAGHRAARTIDPQWQSLAVGDVVPDYGGPSATFEVVSIEPQISLVYRSRRGRVDVSWSITLTPAPAEAVRVHLRLRLGGVRHRRIARGIGGAVDALTIEGLAAGLRERVAP